MVVSYHMGEKQMGLVMWVVVGCLVLWVLVIIERDIGYRADGM